MKGAIAPLIKKLGTEMIVKNDQNTGGSRSMPDHQEVGRMKMISEQRGMPQTYTDSSGTETETNLEYRCIRDANDPELIEAGEGGGEPTIIEDPRDGRAYRVLSVFLEDQDVAVLAVVED